MFPIYCNIAVSSLTLPTALPKVCRIHVFFHSGEAVIEDVVRNEAVPKSKEKEQEGVHDVSIPEVEDKILEHVTNGRVTELEDESLEPGVGDAGTEAGAEPLVDSVTEVKAKGEVKDIDSHGDHKDDAKLKLSSTGKDQTSQEKES